MVSRHKDVLVADDFHGLPTKKTVVSVTSNYI